MLCRIHLLLAVLLLQSLFITGAVSKASHRRRRRQTSASGYGTNTNAGAAPSAGYNYPPNTNFYNTNQNNPGAKDLYGNPIVPANTGNSMNNMNFNNQQQQQQQQQQQMQQQQLYNPNVQSLANPGQTGTNPLLTGNNVNTMVRDSSGNLVPAGSAGASFYSPSNPQVGYQPNTNQLLNNQEMYKAPPNTNPNQYGYNSNNNNNNPWLNSNPNTQYSSNAGSAWNANRDVNTNNNNNNNPYSNSPYLFNHSSRMTMSSVISFVSMVISVAFYL